MLQPYYFVCLSFLLILTEYARCDSDVRRESDARGESDYCYNLEADGWLKLYTAPETWEEAFLKCQDDAVEHAVASTRDKLPAGCVPPHVQNSMHHVTGAVLASPLNQGLAYALQQQMLQFGVNGNIFLGTHDLFSKGHFVSVEGVSLSDIIIKWDEQDNEAGTGHCLTMSADGIVHNSSCTDPLPFICYTKTNECGTFDNKYLLNKQTGSCYKVHLNKQSWAGAYSICESEGGHLVILNDAEEARIVKGLFSPPPTPTVPWDGFPIGLVAWGKDRTWFTIHGESLENVYNEWDANEPNNYGDLNEIRATCKHVNGKLNDIPDDMFPMVFVCEKSPQCKRFEDLPQTTEERRRMCSFSNSNY